MNDKCVRSTFQIYISDMEVLTKVLGPERLISSFVREAIRKAIDDADLRSLLHRPKPFA